MFSADLLQDQALPFAATVSTIHAHLAGLTIPASHFLTDLSGKMDEILVSDPSRQSCHRFAPLIACSSSDCLAPHQLGVVAHVTSAGVPYATAPCAPLLSFCDAGEAKRINYLEHANQVLPARQLSFSKTFGCRNSSKLRKSSHIERVYPMANCLPQHALPAATIIDCSPRGASFCHVLLTCTHISPSTRSAAGGQSNLP
jgi:hypothetical protein